VAINYNNVEIIKSLIDYADRKKIILGLSDDGKYSPMLSSVEIDNIEIVQLLQDYANKNHINLSINKYKKNNNYLYY